MTGLRLLLAVALLAAGARAGDRPYDFREHRLENGLRVVTLERRAWPIVAVQVWYHVGSKDEAPDRQGFAHLFEHMMFRGTDRVGPSDHADLIQSVGGSAGAYTTSDATCFVNELPANQLELALWLEAERMAFLRIDERNFHTERKVVEEERRQEINRPYGLLADQVQAAVFREHPYRWPTLGSIAHLRAAKLEEVEAFWAKHYVPNSAVLVIAGDIEHAKARSLAERHFGWIPSSPLPARTRVIERPQQERRDLRVRDAHAKLPLVGVFVRTVPFGHPDVVPLRLLSWILAGRHRSRLYRAVMWERPFAHNVYPCMTREMEDHGLWGVAAQLKGAGDEERALEAIEAQLDQSMERVVTDEELERARRWLTAEDAVARGTVSGAARQLGWAASLGDAEQVNLRLDAVHQVTAADLLRVARSYFPESNRTRVRVEPGGPPVAPEEGAVPALPPGNLVARRTGTKANLQRPASFPASPPIGPPLATFPTIPQSRRRLDNGLEVVVVPDRDVPLASCSLSFRFGAASEAKPGAANLAVSLLTRGTAKRDATALLEASEGAGVTFHGRADHDAAHVVARCFPEQLDAVVELLAEMARFPRMDGEYLELERGMLIRSLDSRLRDATELADAVFGRHLYGTHPYGRLATGAVDDMRRLTREDLLEWWGRFGRPDVAVLYVAGDVAPEAAFRSAERHFGDWKATGPPPEPVPRPPPGREKRRIVIVNRPGSVQSEIRVGQIAITRHDPDWAGAHLLSVILGGTPTSRVNKRLRERQGLTYWADGGFAAEREAGIFWMRTSTETARTSEALADLLDVLQQLRGEGPTQEEIRRARNCVAGQLASRWEAPEAVVADVWLADNMGLTPDYIQRTLAAHAAATPDDLRRIARTRIDPDTLLIVVVGDAAKIQADLATIAPVTVQ
ncbi:MAG: insulinase family protein [Planctomycetes bacterium]|nr:insulinase family protein [Planctomycetota bacterium]